MYDVKPTAHFQRDLKRVQRRGYNMALLTDVIKLLAAGQELAPKYRDHALSGKYIGCRECHVTPDWLLIYEISGTDLYLYLTRTGTHADLF